MNYLALSTVEGCSAALDCAGVQQQRNAESNSHQSRALPALVSRLLNDAGITAQELDGILCCIGPGGFASVRVGVAFAKAFALAADLSIGGVSSLAMLAAGASRKHCAARVLAAMDARMGEVYVADYSVDGCGYWHTCGESVCRPDQIKFKQNAIAATTVACGSGWQVHRETLLDRHGIGQLAHFDAAAIPQAIDAFKLLGSSGDAFTGFLEPVQLRPSYLRNHVALTLQERKIVQRRE